MDCILESMTLKKIAIKLGISLKTAFLCRHELKSKDVTNSLGLMKLAIGIPQLKAFYLVLS
ncbi:MAG: hypothetical protein B6229_09710 [Spirochaetaceae bacterium 4572_7]|nr:MAG: hypothetical protein B6229_09710 [Spirochaetaceae bacterium 4572_7]